MEKELRKRQILLWESGAGVILFAVWNLTRANLYLALTPFPMEVLQEEAAQVGISEKFLMIMMIVVVAGILIWQLSIRLYIGMSARAEGKGKKKSYTYLVWTAILVVSDLQINWRAFDVQSILSGGDISGKQIASLCLEAASVYVLLQLLISGIWVKRLRKKMKE